MGASPILQTDACVAYKQVGGSKLVHAGCWAHARRGFLGALKLNPREEAAKAVVSSIDELFGIDAQARERGLDLAARQALRQEQVPRLLYRIRQQMEAARAVALPSGALAKAARHTLALGPRLTRPLEYPELKLSNNLA